MHMLAKECLECHQTETKFYIAHLSLIEAHHQLNSEPDSDPTEAHHLVPVQFHPTGSWHWKWFLLAEVHQLLAVLT